MFFQAEMKKGIVLTMKIITEYGIVGIFDILGYRNLMLNNKIEITAEIVLEIIEKIPSFVRNRVMASILHPEGRKIAIEILNQISWKIFSDTIFTCLPIKKEGVKPFDVMKWGIFLASCLSLQRDTFDKGLPLRGAISTGYYFLEKNCFVGQPVIDAYDLCQKQNWSGCALTQSAGMEFIILIEKTQAKVAAHNIDNFLSQYYVPMKKSKSVQLFCLRWGGARNLLTLPPEVESRRRDKGINEYVRGRFQAYLKGSPKNVLTKIHNTEKYLQFVKSTYST